MKETQLIELARAVQDACVDACIAGVDLVRQNGYKERADAQLQCVESIRRIDIAELAQNIQPTPPSPSEIGAFEDEARRQFFNTAKSSLGGYTHPLTNRALRIWKAAMRYALNEPSGPCKHCNDTGSLSKSLEGQYDCHHCGRADENVRVLKWYADTHLDSGSEADVLNVYYHGVEAGADLQRARIAELEREVAANRQQIAQLDRELSAERMVHGATKRLKEQLDAQLRAAPAPQWQPIESAPQDGYFLVHEDTAIRAIMRIAGKWQSISYPTITGGAWGEVHVGADAQRLLPTGYKLGIGDGCCENPTHWMPLPAAPSPADNGGGNG